MVKNLNNDTIRKVGQKIRIERYKRHLSQERLSELANLNRNFIGMIERAETNVTIKNLECIANALEVDIKELFDFYID